VVSSESENHPIQKAMKRYGNLFSRIVDIENLRLAYRRARKGKNWQRAIRAFDKNAEENLAEIRQSLINKTFHTSSYKTKTIYEPKQRQIHILPFSPDRIVQHALMNVVEPIWESLFIYDSYACRAGKGIHAGSRRVMNFLRKNKYCLKCDISKFYPSMKHDILFELIKQKIKCKDTLWLMRDIVYSIGDKQNVPIGNYTSQWFGNLYMNELDQELKHRHKIKHYIRYCDDFVLFHNDKRYLREIGKVIEEFLEERLQLKFSKCSIFPVNQGIDFLGYRHFRRYILLRKSTAKRVKKRLNRLPLILGAGRITLEQFRSSLASTMGWLKWANAHNLFMKLQIKELMELCNAA
jgi:RNA-directed DNA polymerase